MYWPCTEYKRPWHEIAKCAGPKEWNDLIRKHARPIRAGRLYNIAPSSYCNILLKFLGYKEVFNRSLIVDFVIVDGHACHYTQQQVLEKFVPQIRLRYAWELRRSRHYKAVDKCLRYMQRGTWNAQEVKEFSKLRENVTEAECLEQEKFWNECATETRRRNIEKHWSSVWPLPGD